MSRRQSRQEHIPHPQGDTYRPGSGFHAELSAGETGGATTREDQLRDTLRPRSDASPQEYASALGELAHIMAAREIERSE